jgi:hypothetical protein
MTQDEHHQQDLESVIASPGADPDPPSVGGRGPGDQVATDLLEGSWGRITPDTSAVHAP